MQDDEYRDPDQERRRTAARSASSDRYRQILEQADQARSRYQRQYDSGRYDKSNYQSGASARQQRAIEDEPRVSNQQRRPQQGQPQTQRPRQQRPLPDAYQQTPRQAAGMNMPGRGSGPRFQMPNGKLPLIIAIILVIVLVLVIGGCVRHCSSVKAEEEAQKQAEQEQQSEETETAEDTASEAYHADYAVFRTAEERSATSSSANDVKPTTHVVYLTFDDGPSVNTPKILEILNQYGVPATWFVLGNSEHLEYVNNIWDAGSQVAIHSNCHVYQTIYASADAFWQDITDAGNAISQYLGFSPTIFRFPGGSVNDYNKAVRDTIFQQATEKQMHFFDWNVSDGDAGGNGIPAETLIQNVRDGSDGKNSCCVLMHDTQEKSTTVDALPGIIQYYIDEGYTFDVLTADSFGYHF